MSPHLSRIPSSIRIRRTDSDQYRATENAPVNNHGRQPQQQQKKNNDSDDNVLRREMSTARQAIHDQEQRHQSPAYESMGADLPPVRFHQQGPLAPKRKSSRRMGAVEHLALRQKKQQRKAQNSATNTATNTSASSTRSKASTVDQDLQWHRSTSAGSATRPDLQPQRLLSHVREETPTSRGAASSVAPADPSYFPAENQTASSSVGQESTPASRPRRNTGTDESIIASSRNYLGNLLRRNTDAAPQRLDDSTHSSRRRNDDDDEDEDDDDDDYNNNNHDSATTSPSVSDVHEDEVVDYLDVVDPEVSTVTALQNVGNSIFFPPIPMLYNRRPTISLSGIGQQRRPSRTATPASEHQPDDIEMGVPDAHGTIPAADKIGARPSGRYGMNRVASYVTGKRNKSVPETTEEERRKHIHEWAEMDQDERSELDEHVEMLLTRKAKLKRGLKGFWRYVKTPHGFIITVYAVLVTFWGTAICLFLLRWIDVHNAARQRYWIEICDQILCALFSAVGLGFAPFRAVDTYRMVQIVHYHKLTYKRRKQLDLPKLQDKNELPRATPRIGVGQMANNMFIKTGLRKSPTAARDAAQATTTQSSNESNEVALEAQTSRHSSQVEQLKLSHKHHRPEFLRKHKTKKDASEDQGEDVSEGDKKSRVLPKTYVNKDGVVPLGHLKRNPSIASELVRDAEDVVVLSAKQQANLEYQQRKFHESHTFYRYRETVTHRPFELSLMMAVVILLDCHSCLQASLGGTTWGIYYKNRPTSVTATIITFSLSCNAVAGILIGWGGSRTKKKDEVSRLLRIALEEQALLKIQKKHKRQQLEALESHDPDSSDSNPTNAKLTSSNSSSADTDDPNPSMPQLTATRSNASAIDPASSTLQPQTLESIQEH